MTIRQKHLIHRDVYGPGTTGGPIERSNPRNDALALERLERGAWPGSELIDIPPVFKFSQDFEDSLGYDPEEHDVPKMEDCE